MRYFSVNSGQYPKFNDIQLTVYKNQNTVILFDWNTIFRSWDFVPKITDFKFRLTMTIDAKLNMDNNVLCIMSSDMGEITIDEDYEMIICKLDIENTKDLRLYDGGMFSFDYAKIDNNEDNTMFANKYNKGYYRLCSGKWSVDSNAMIIDGVENDNISSYLNYNNVGSNEIVTSFVYDVVEPNH